MNSQTLHTTQPGPAGSLALALDRPAVAQPQGVAVVCHPHPVHGGTLHNKVVQTVVRAFLHCGWRTVRFNFRGVGDSTGQWDEGRGEVDDAWAVVQAQCLPGERLALAGFSFGGYVASQVAARRAAEQQAAGPLVLVGPATLNFKVAPVPADTLVVHGQTDDVVPLSATLDWAQPQGLPVVVIPGVGHFFHGHLPLLKTLVVRHLHGIAADC